jgi:hypothetical protein
MVARWSATARGRPIGSAREAFDTAAQHPDVAQ